MEQNKFFFGPGGLRAGWRVAIFILLFAALAVVTTTVWNLVFFHSFHPQMARGEMNPRLMLVGTSSSVVAIALTLLILATTQRESFSAYGLPFADAFRGKFWGGLALGFAAMSLLLWLIHIFHGFDFGSAPDSPAAEARFGALYALGFLLVGFFEELMMRSYLLYTLTRGVGFWGAAVISSIIFAVLHLGNPGEGATGIFAVFCAGLLFCFFIRRTGNLWFAIGFHASWDWAQTYFYGVPDSGTTAAGNLFHPHFSGPKWLTGGSVGPEGSYLVFLVLALSALAVHFFCPRPRYPALALSVNPNDTSMVTEPTVT